MASMFDTNARRQLFPASPAKKKLFQDDNVHYEPFGFSTPQYHKNNDPQSDDENTTPPVERIKIPSSGPCPPTPTRPKSMQKSPTGKKVKHKLKPKRLSEQLSFSLDGHGGGDEMEAEHHMATSFSVPDLTITPADEHFESQAHKCHTEGPVTPLRVVRYKTNVNPYSPSRAPAAKEIMIPTEKETVPRFVSDFEIHQEIGKGSFSTVFLCVNRTDGWNYAVKKLVYQSEKMKDKFLKEAYALAALGHHDHLVRYYGAWEQSQSHTIYIQTEWCKGGSLRKHLPAFDQQELCRVITQVGKALSYMHIRGFPHGDVKPENVLVDTETILPTTMYKLCDLGQIGESGDGMYLAPEVLNSDCDISDPHLLGKADVFSLGMTIFELAYERAMDSPLPLRQRSQIEQQDINLPVSMYDVTFVELLRNMMQRDPQSRPSADGILRLPVLVPDYAYLLEQERIKVSQLQQRIIELEAEVHKQKVHSHHKHAHNHSFKISKHEHNSFPSHSKLHGGSNMVIDSPSLLDVSNLSHGKHSNFLEMPTSPRSLTADFGFQSAPVFPQASKTGFLNVTPAFSPGLSFT